MLCRAEEREWKGTLLSLSENGCLLRSVDEVSLGMRFSLQLKLPGEYDLLLEVETSYQLLPDLGLTFHATSPTDRAAISRYVTRALSGPVDGYAAESAAD